MLEEVREEVVKKVEAGVKLFEVDRVTYLRIWPQIGLMRVGILFVAEIL